MHTTVADTSRQAEPKFQADEKTLLRRLVLRGSDSSKPAAARLSSANDLLFHGDPFGIYRTVQFQTNMWEMLLSYREVGQECVVCWAGRCSLDSFRLDVLPP